MHRDISNRVLVLATLAMLVSFAVWGLISAQSTRFQEELGLSDIQTGVMIAVPVLLGSIIRIPMGILTERYGGRRVFTVLLLFVLIPVIGLSQTVTYEGILFWGLFLGMAGTSFAVGIPLVSKWFNPEKQGLVLGLYGVGNIGTAVANFTIPYLNKHAGVLNTFYIYAGIVGVFSCFYYLLVRDAPAKGRTSTLRDSVEIVKTSSAVWVLSIFYFLTFGSFVAMGNYLPKFLIDIFHISKIDAGLKAAGFVVVATLFRPVGGYAADQYGGHQILNKVFVVMAVMAGILSISTAFYPVTAASLILAAAAGIGNGAVFKLVPLYYPQQTGIATGIAGAAGGIGGFFPPLLMGYVRQMTGSYFWGYVLLGLFAVLCWRLNVNKQTSITKG